MSDKERIIEFEMANDYKKSIPTTSQTIPRRRCDIGGVDGLDFESSLSDQLEIKNTLVDVED